MSAASEARIQDPRGLSADRGSRPLTAPAPAGGLHRPGGAQGPAGRLDRRGREPRRGARPRAARRVRPARKDVAGADRGRRARVPWRPPARRSSARATSPPSSPPLNRGRCSSSTRSTACPGARGDLLPGDGGRVPADHGRPRRRRSGGHARSAAVHADRRDHPHRPADHAAAGPVRDPAPPRALRERGSGPDRPSLGAAARASPSRTVALAIAARSRGTPRVANRLLKRVRDYAEVRGSGVVTGGVAAAALECSRSITRGSTVWIARSCARSARSSGVARSGSRRSPWPWARSRTRSRMSTSPICSSAGLIERPLPVAAPPPGGRLSLSGLEPPGSSLTLI